MDNLVGCQVYNTIHLDRVWLCVFLVNFCVHDCKRRQKLHLLEGARDVNEIHAVIHLVSSPSLKCHEDRTFAQAALAVKGSRAGSVQMFSEGCARFLPSLRFDMFTLYDVTSYHQSSQLDISKLNPISSDSHSTHCPCIIASSCIMDLCSLPCSNRIPSASQNRVMPFQ